MILTVTVIVIVSLLEHAYSIPCIGLQISTCDCTGTIVDCSFKSLTAIPEGVPMNTTELNLGDNDISTIAANAFDDLASLETLILHGNTISSLPDGLFSNNINLRRVSSNKILFRDLWDNDISTIAANTFDSLASLKFLDLNINTISSLPEELFSKNINLESVDLEENSLTSVPAQLFLSNINLEVIDLSNNNFSSLPLGLLSSNIKLEKVDLDDNKLSSLPSGFFSSNVKLDNIKLQENAFTTVSANIFMAVTNIARLDLDDNQLLCCNMTDLFEWAALQTKATLYGDCTDFGIVTDIQEFDISNCIIPVNGQWSSWTTTSCSMTCGNGMIYRNRTCNNPSPSDGGKDCQGVGNESSVCNLGDCPVDGHWGLWSSVRCSVSCGYGIGIRTRRCDNPLPSADGNGCVGCDMERKLCSLGKCDSE
ncbi:unnamed protein product [Mytilus coruscus]|uniref:LRRNT domain-containing protein n=1 Tax=Mytilus coruscus TaxID=42192 RepID=A0A6J8AMZ9_MYTCO|nr:unnamed protein product [Mytilus coruscus]